MSFPRRAARTMLAAIFIQGGLQQLRRPEPLVDTADPVAMPVAEQVPPLPTDTARLVKIDGAVKLVGGALLVTDPLHRPAALALAGSLVPTTLAGHRFWAETDPAARAAQQTHFLKNLGLLGGLLLDAVDTGGRPSIPWRTRRAAHRASTRMEDAVGTTRDSVAGTAGALAAAVGAVGAAVAHRAAAAKDTASHAAAEVAARAQDSAAAAKDTATHAAAEVAARAQDAAATAKDAAGAAKDAAATAKDRATDALSR